MDKSSETMQIAAAGLRAQSARMRVIAENLANAQSTGRTPEEDPYRRQVPVFEAEVGLVHEPGHPAANAEGYVRYPCVSSLVELMDMKEAQRSYEANMNMVENTRRMMERTLELLRR